MDQYGDKLEYGEDEPHLFDMLGESEGNDTVVIYCKKSVRSSGFRQDVMCARNGTDREAEELLWRRPD